MGRIWDIFLMVLGVAMLIIVSTVDELRFRYGVLGYLGAFACIGFGIKAVMDSVKDRKGMKLINTPIIEGFYQNTKKAWMEDKLRGLGASFKKEGQSSSLKQLKKSYLPYTGSALNTFFVRYRPELDEFLVSMSHGTIVQDNSWFVLTNKRLIQKNGETNEYNEFELKSVLAYGIDKEKSVLNFKMRSGEYITLSKVSHYPRKKYVDILISQGTRF